MVFFLTYVLLYFLLEFLFTKFFLGSRSLFFAFCVPQLFTWFQSAKVYLMRKNEAKWPYWHEFGTVLTIETIHTIGLALLFYIVLPELDTIRGI